MVIYHVVTALLKVEILKANHNFGTDVRGVTRVVTALLKVEILKANHNANIIAQCPNYVVTALAKIHYFSKISTTISTLFMFTTC